MAKADVEAPARLTETVVRGAGLTGAGSLLTQVVTLATYVVLARLAGPEVFGAFAAAWIIVGVSSLFVESGMSAALIQRKDRLEEAAATATVATFAAGVGLTALALALSPVVGLYFHSNEIGKVSAALSGILLVNAATVVPDALMRRRFSFLRRGVIDPITALVYGVAGAMTLANGMGVWGLVLAAYISGVTRLTAVWMLNRWLPDFRKVSVAMWRELARFARHIVASELLRVLSDVANTALLGRFLGLAPLGAYRFGWRMATQAAFPVASASTYVLLPAFARISDDSIRLRAAFLRSLRLFAALVLPISLVVAVLGNQAAVALLGERWRAAGGVLTALAGVTAGLPFITLAAEVFKATNRPNLMPRVSLLLSTSMLTFMILLLPLGATGVAGGVSLAYLLAATFALSNVARVLALPLRTILVELCRPAIASSGLAAAVTLFAIFVVQVDDAPALVRLGWLGAEMLLGLLVYGALMLKLAPETVSELRDALRSLTRRRPVIRSVPAPANVKTDEGR